MRGLIFMTVMMGLVAGGAGWFFFGGEGDQVDLTPGIIKDMRAFEAAEELAAQGDREGYYRLGLHYLEGRGTSRDERAALKSFTIAARASHADAQYRLAKMYEKGIGVRQNYFKAAEWYEIAASIHGHPGAMFALGDLYIAGRGVPNDNGVAADWFEKAAIQGHAPSQFILGAFEEEGWGRDRDYVRAYAWYSLASRDVEAVETAKPSFDVMASLTGLESRMNRAQLAEARRFKKRLEARIGRP
ncbi:MAG: tetratricopeptide repeat protein [Magnetovibrionaceae bacterium]